MDTSVGLLKRKAQALNLFLENVIAEKGIGEAVKEYQEFQSDDSLSYLDELPFVFIPNNEAIVRGIYDNFNDEMARTIDYKGSLMDISGYDSDKVYLSYSEWNWYNVWNLTAHTLNQIVSDTFEIKGITYTPVFETDEAKEFDIKNKAIEPTDVLKDKFLDILHNFVNVDLPRTIFAREIDNIDFSSIYQSSGGKLPKLLRRKILSTFGKENVDEKEMDKYLSLFIQRNYIKDSRRYLTKFINKKDIAIGKWESDSTCLAVGHQNEMAGDLFRYSPRFKAIGIWDSDTGQKVGRAIVHFNGDRTITVLNWYFPYDSKSPLLFVKALETLLNFQSYEVEYVKGRANHLPIYANDGYYIVKNINNKPNKRKYLDEPKYFCPFCGDITYIIKEQGEICGVEISSYSTVVYCESCEDTAYDYYKRKGINRSEIVSSRRNTELQST